MKKEEILYKLTALCAAGEHCSQEMLDKMQNWGVAETDQAEIMAYLVKERYIDDERYCRAFVKSKIKYNKWGRRKIEQGLYLKHIPKEISSKVLSEVEDREYLEVLEPLLVAKRPTIKARNDYELRQKLIRFALSRGFDMDIIQHLEKFLSHL